MPANQESLVVIEPKQEDDESIQAFANSSKCALLAFVAPHFPEKVSPRRAAYAMIGVQEEFGIETFIDLCSEANVRSLHFLVNTPGGSVSSSFKVARALRDHFTNIRVFVPHVAASGGTMIALTGNEIVMGKMSHLTPVDVQVPYNGAWVSTNSILRSFDRFASVYQEAMLADEEAPYPLRAMCDKLDPVVMEEMVGQNGTCADYIARLLKEGGVEEHLADRQALFLTTGLTSHGTVLHRDVLLSEKFRVVEDSKYPTEWKIMREWLKKHVGESGLIHRIMYCLPKNKSGKLSTRRGRIGTRRRSSSGK